MSATQILYAAAGRPKIQRSTEPCAEECCVCGVWCDAGIPADNAFGTGFAGFDSFVSPTSTHVCVACSWAMAGKPPATLRLWSIVYRQDRPAAPSNAKAMHLSDRIHLTAKNDLREVAELLLEPPGSEWVCTVAESGQKHCLPFAVVNRGAPWTVRFEATDVTGDPAQFGACLFHAAALKQLGFFTSDILTGRPAIGRLALHMAAWRRHDEALRFYRRGQLLELALICLTKEHTHEIGQRAAGVIGVEWPPHDGRGADGAGGAVSADDARVGEHGEDRPAGLVGPGAVGARDGSDVGRLAADGQPRREEAADRLAHGGQLGFGF